ncbi:MAG TPA: hypothetical protein VGO47_13020, partial [Chlamydiales bacterium]|nr:hypothetical protein [Chlamydiales bacterium]
PETSFRYKNGSCVSSSNIVTFFPHNYNRKRAVSSNLGDQYWRHHELLCLCHLLVFENAEANACVSERGRSGHERQGKDKEQVQNWMETRS